MQLEQRTKQVAFEAEALTVQVRGGLCRLADWYPLHAPQKSGRMQGV
jgi:hypothetical protein